MRVLYRYLFQHYIRICIFFILMVILLAFLIDFTENMNRYDGKDLYPVSAIVLMSFFHIPYLLGQLLAFVSLFTALTHFIFLNKKGDLVVFRSAGISAWQFIFPACCAAFLLGLLGIFILNPIAAYSMKKATDIVTVKHNLDQNFLNHSQNTPWFSQQNQENTTFIGTTNIAEDGKILRGVTFVMLGKDSKNLQWIHAPYAQLKEGYWLVPNATCYAFHKNPAILKDLQIKTDIKPHFIAQSLQDQNTVPYYDLPQKITIAKAFGYPDQKWKFLLYQLFSVPLSLVVMTLIAANVSLKFDRFYDIKRRVLYGLIFGFALYSIEVIIVTFGKAGWVPPIAACWLPPFVALFISIIFLLEKEDG